MTNQREIKFRAWDKKTNRMCPVWDVGWKAWDDDNAINYVNIELDGTEERMEHEVILMQYTNLKDKNGKKIWEGDIVRQGGTGEEPIMDVVEWHSGAFQTKSTNTYIEWNTDDGKKGTPPELLWEVIGNIYENPDLLGDKESGEKG